MKEKEEKDAAKKELDNKIADFNKKIKNSDDLNDNLQELVEHLAEFTGASACYVGKVDKPIKGIKDGLKEDDDENAHNIAGAQPQVQFLYANAASEEILKDKILDQNQGVTFKLFQDDQTHATNPCIFDGTDGPDGMPKHILIDQVVRNKDIHYYQVPKLGSYLAIKLEYMTCLFEEAYDAAVENYTSINDQMKE